jgi:beta-lactamase regulating signal transducer with metallopeptidase domain/HEAT repeat protein
MNAVDGIGSMLYFLAEEPLLGRLFLASVEMAVLAGLVWFVVRIGLNRSARWQSFLWLLVLLKPFMVVAIGALVPVVQFEVTPPPIQDAEKASTLDPSAMQEWDSPASPPGDTQWRTSPATVESHVDTFPESIEPPPTVPAAPADRAPVTPPQPTNRTWNGPRTLVQLWVLGVLLLGAYAVFDRWRLRRLVMRAQPAGSELAARYAGVAEALRIKRPPRMRVTESLESPALAGTIRPTVLLPSWMAEDASSAKLDWALRHELTHWKLGDVWALAAQQFAQIVFFFNPVTWWACRKWQEAAELACDRAVVETERDVEEYADNLYQVLAEIHGQRRGLLAGGLFATRTQIGRRIAMLLGNPLKQPARLGTTGAVILLGVAAISLSVGISFAAGNQPPSTSDVTADVQQAIDEAITMLSTTSEMERDRVTAVLDIVRAQPQGPAMTALCQWLENDTATRRRSAIHIIGALEWEDASPAYSPLRRLLTHNEAATRGMAALSLGRTGDLASFDVIVGMALNDRDAYARRCAAFALGDLGDLRALEPLEKIRTDSNSGVSSNAENAIERLTYLRDHIDADGNAEQIVRAIWIVAGSTSFDEARIGRAVEMARGVAPDIRSTILKEASKSPSATIQNGAAVILAALSETPVRETDVQKAIDVAIAELSVTSAIESDRVETILDIVRAQPQGPALQTLCEWLASDVATKRRSAVYIIGLLPWEDARPAIQPLRDLLTHDESFTRGMAAMSLATIGDADSYDAMIEMAREDEDAYARRCAAYALGDLGDPRAIEPLEAVKEDADPNVARNAGNAIDRLTFLRDHADAEGDAKLVVRAIWFVAASPEWDQSRLKRSLDLMRGVPHEVGTPILAEASTSSSKAIREGATRLLGEFAKTSMPPAGMPAREASEEQEAQPTSPAPNKRDWGPEQATDAPDTEGPGDIVTAWASLTQDAQPEWLLLEYERAVRPHSVKVYETYNPGAVVKVSVIDESGEEILAWEGSDPTRPEQQTGVSEIPIGVNSAVRNVKLYLDSPSVPGWNEIDAVGLVDDSGEIHWAVTATASSTYAEKPGRSAQPATEPESTPVGDDPKASELIPQNATLLTYTDSTAEGKRSLGASGHAVRFERSGQPFLEAVQIAASRYGSPEPPDDSFHLYVLNASFQILADVPFPYAMIERGDQRWYTLRTPSIEVPETFYIALAFNPHRTKGIYLSYDRDVSASHSSTGLPDSGYEPVDETYDWMVRLCMSAEPSGEKGVQRLADWSPPKYADPFEGLVEVKYDDGVSDGKQSYGGAGPCIRFPDRLWGAFVGERAVTDTEAFMGVRVYGSRYGSGYNPESTMLHLIVQDQDGNELAKADFPYSLFSYKEQWVDLELPAPARTTVSEIVCILDPEAHQTKGIYFHYKKDPEESHSGVAKNGKADKPTPDREWMIRGYFRR